MNWLQYIPELWSHSSSFKHTLPLRSENKRLLSDSPYHDCNEVPIIIRQRPITAQDEVLRAQEDVQVSRMITHDLGHVI